MRVGFPGGPRLEWYDRNPIKRSFDTGDLTYGPHSATIRSTYTVPTGKKAFLSSVFCQVRRISVATTSSWVRITINEGSSAFLEIYRQVPAVADGGEMALGACGAFNAGDVLTAITEDGSTGGTVLYHGAATLTEFDA